MIYTVEAWYRYDCGNEKDFYHLDIEADTEAEALNKVDSFYFKKEIIKKK